MELHDIQTRVHVGKDKRNEFGGYNYRTAEGILAALKAALPPGGHVIVSDEMQEIAGQIFVTATATLHLPECPPYVAKGHAMHPLTKKGMDPSQITGAASSYARKLALSGLLALDDGSADPDAAKAPYEPEHAPPPPDHAKTRDRILKAIADKRDGNTLAGLMRHKATVDALASLPEPMRNQVNAAAKARADAITKVDAALENSAA